MRALFSLASLVIVLCVITVAVQHQLRASRALAPAAPGATAPGASAAGPGAGAHPSSVARYKSDLDATLQRGADGRGVAVEAAEAPPAER